MMSDRVGCVRSWLMSECLRNSGAAATPAELTAALLDLAYDRFDGEGLLRGRTCDRVYFTKTNPTSYGHERLQEVDCRRPLLPPNICRSTFINLVPGDEVGTRKGNVPVPLGDLAEGARLVQARDTSCPP